MKVAVVTGTRTDSRYGVITRALNKFNPDLVVHGACLTGVDAEANVWAHKKRRRVVTCPADWTCGKAAGPFRNVTLAITARAFECAIDADAPVTSSHEVRVFAVPDPAHSPGTANAAAELTKLGLRVEVL